MLVIAPNGAGLVDSILAELAASEAWQPEQSSTIVWFLGASDQTRQSADDGRWQESAPSMALELKDDMPLQRGCIYFVPPQRRVWFDGSTARVAPLLPHDEHPLDRLLLALADEWGERSVAVLALALAEDGQRGMLGVVSAGGVAWHHPPAALRAKSLTSAWSGWRTSGSQSAPVSRAATGSGAPPAAESSTRAGASSSGEATASAESSRMADSERDQGPRPDSASGPVASRAPSEPPPAERTLRSFAPLPPVLARIKAACRGVLRMRGGRLRVWVPGCKTGGTAYLVAMLLADAAAELSAPLQATVHGTDADESALAVARLGRYSTRSALGMDPELRGRYTFDEADAIRVSERVRRLCRFSRHDLFRDPPLSRMDLVVCQGLFEGTPHDLQRELGEVLHYSVRHGGLLLALDRPDAFPAHLFERSSQGLLEARPGPPGATLQRRLAASLARADAGSTIPEPPLPGAAQSALPALGVPLIACDEVLRVTFISLEASSAFRLSPRDVSRPLAAIVSRLPAGADLLRGVKHAVEHAKAEEFTIQQGRRTYLARISPTGAAAHGCVSLVFSDVTALSDARALAMAQRLQHAALARVSEVALSGATLSELCEEALGALFGNIPPCASGMIIELAGPARELRTLASRGLGAEPLWTSGDAVTLVRAVLERGALVSSTGEHARPDEPASRGSEPGSVRSARALSLPEPAVGCPISAGDEQLGVIALFGRRPSIADRDYQHFIQAVANVLGGAMLRHRTRRRIELELEVGRVLARSADMEQMHAGLHAAFERTLSAAWVELWTKDEASPEHWSRACPAADDAPVASPWPDDLSSPHQADVVVSASGREPALLVPIRGKQHVTHVLRLGGAQLLLPDRELAEGLQGVARLIREFLERLRVLAAARRSEAAHRQKSAELEALYASLPVGVSIHDRQGAIRRTNSQLALLRAPHGTEGAEPLKRLYSEQLPAWIARVVASGEDVRDIELGVRQGDNLWFWLCNLAPIVDPTGEVQSVSVAVQDITPLKRVEAALRETDRQKDDFLAILGHELRNPMAAIRNATELLGRVAPESPQLSRLHGIFDRQTQHTTQLIDGLLDVARVARGKIDLSPVPVALVQVLRQVVDDRRQQFRDRVLDLRLPEGEVWIRADRVRLIQIIDNLLSNALKFTQTGGRIGIELVEREEEASLVIDDDGAGIEPELLPRIFEPFRQGQATRAQSQGLGLGLALVKGLVDLHGYRLAASSPGVGQGARFRIDIPIAGAPESRPPPSQVDSRPLDLLLVEDDADIAETLSELLAGLGHRVERFSSAEEALIGLGRSHPDVLLCDIGLPGMDGVEFAARVRADPASRDLPLVAMTGFGDASTRARIDQAGFDRHLIKPVQLASLQECLSRVVALPRSRVRR